MQIDTFLRAFANPRAFLLYFPLFFFACETEKPPFIPPVDPASAPLTIRHFEKDLFAGDTSDYAGLLQQLEADYPDFTNVFFRYAIPLKRGDFSPEEQANIMQAFLEYPMIQEVYKLSQEQFSDWRSSKAEIQTGLANLKYYLPDVVLPDTLVTFISQFQFAGFQFGESQLAAGLDMFIGPDFDYTSVSATEPIFSDYLKRTYTPEHLSSKMLQLLIDEQIPQPDEGRLIDYMVANGKKMYLLDLVFPETPDSILFEMTGQQVEWLNGNEAPIYIYLQQQDLLYETDLRKYRKYIEPSPNSPGMPDGAPGRSANWLGMRIVKAYMQNNPTKTVEDLISITDGQEILAKSRFKPK